MPRSHSHRLPSTKQKQLRLNRQQNRLLFVQGPFIYQDLPDVKISKLLKIMHFGSLFWSVFFGTFSINKFREREVANRY